MKCEECNTNDANVHLTQIIQDETTIFHLCESCARKRGISVSVEAFGAAAVSEPSRESELDVVCPGCRLRLSEFRSQGRLGCAQCYQAFESEIDELLLQVHGAKVHRGKSCPIAAEAMVGALSLDQLKSQLERAIKGEEFELAAYLRDAINSLAGRNAPMAARVEEN